MGPQGSSAWLISKLNWGPPTQAHNGYLDIVNELGLIGLTGFICWSMSHARRLYRLYKSRDVAAEFHVIFFLALLITNISETSFMRTTHLWRIAMMASSIEVGFVLFNSTSAKRAGQDEMGSSN
jgi:O-antigen ligase